MLVSMWLSEKYAVPPEVALLYDFVNTLDQRQYVESGATHAGGDEIETPRLLEAWMSERGLLHRREHVGAGHYRAALELRKGLRDFLRNPPEHRPQATVAGRQLTAASRDFPLALIVSENGAVELAAASGSSALGSVLAQMIGLAKTSQMARLKTCASEDCHWIFFDRSKPANRHWCSSLLCGNRQKTRAYRERRRQVSA